MNKQFTWQVLANLNLMRESTQMVIRFKENISEGSCICTSEFELILGSKAPQASDKALYKARKQAPTP